MTAATIAEAEATYQISYQRQRDWFDPAAHPDAHVAIVGAGGIGSPTALALAKLGIPKLTLIDYDLIEPHNIPNQMYPLATAGTPKVEVLASVAEDFSLVDATPVDARLEDVAPAAYRGVVIAALDSMEARTQLWEKVKLKPQVELLLDARLGGESIVVYSCVPHSPADIRAYEDTLYTDEEASPAPCTRQSIIDVGFAVASLLTRAVRKHYAGEPVEHQVYLDQANLIVMKEARS